MAWHVRCQGTCDPWLSSLSIALLLGLLHLGLTVCRRKTELLTFLLAFKQRVTKGKNSYRTRTQVNIILWGTKNCSFLKFTSFLPWLGLFIFNFL